VTAAAVAGSLLGGRFAGRIPEDVLRRAFGWFVVVTGVFVLVQQVPDEVRSIPSRWVALGLAAVAAIGFAVRRNRRRDRHAAGEVVAARGR
jgi:uncharacterized membrane protein YfcA